jgi:hypothetical protein
MENLVIWFNDCLTTGNTGSTGKNQLYQSPRAPVFPVVKQSQPMNL